MWRIRCLPLILWAMVFLSHILLITSSKAPLYMSSKGKGISGQYIVVLKNGVTPDQFIDSGLLDSIGDHVFHKYRMLNGFCARLSKESLRKLLDSSMVKYIEEDQMSSVNELESWGIDRVDQRDLPLNDDNNRDYIGDGKNVHIYVLDTGVRYSHPDFAGRTGDGYNFIEDSLNPGDDCNGHGTHCAGIAAGSTYGVATGATIHDVRVLGCDGSGPFSGIIAGFEWVIEHHTKPAVASISLGGPYSRVQNEVIQMMVDAGIVVSVAAGNDNRDACVDSPASAPAALTVGATTREDYRSYDSNFGACVDIFAPGSEILSAHFQSDTEPLQISGTSQACPHVSGECLFPEEDVCNRSKLYPNLLGAAAILLGIDSALTPQEVTDLLLRGASQNKVKDAHFLSPNRLLYIGEATCMTRCGASVDLSRSCDCDSECSSRNGRTCCDDYTYLCWENAPTCNERCGENADDTIYPCQCDEACSSRKDCCPDYGIRCQPDIPCDSTHDHEDTYYSPYYPSTPNDQTCRTVINIPDGFSNAQTVVFFTFPFSFLDHSNTCNDDDSLTIYDGNSDSSPVLATKCTFDVPSAVATTGHSATAVLRTDSISPGIAYTFDITFAEVRTVTAPGYITSDNFPANYPNDARIITRVFAPPGEQILLDFTDFDIEPTEAGDFCFDFLSVYDSTGNGLGLELCTDVPNKVLRISPLKSRGSSLTLYFLSDSTIPRSGYRATVTFVKPCDSTLTRPGMISSNNYPSGYYNNERCYTTITAKCGKQVLVTFTDFELQERARGTGVCLDYVRAYNGLVPDKSALIGELCGSGAQPQIRSFGATLLLEFASDSNTPAKGYAAEVHFVQAVKALLVDGETPSEGRVEIDHNKYGKGSVCGNNWDIKDASVVCKMLGYGAARDAPGTSFGHGNANVLLADIGCSGSEFNIDQCQHSSWRPEGTCNQQDANAICYQKGEVPLPIRLIDSYGYVSNIGRVELRIGDEWGTICGNSWDLLNAEVVCKSLGYRGAQDVLDQGDVVPGSPDYPIFFDNVQCDGVETGIEFCRHSGVGNHNCNHSSDVGVICIAD